MPCFLTGTTQLESTICLDQMFPLTLSNVFHTACLHASTLDCPSHVLVQRSVCDMFVAASYWHPPSRLTPSLRPDPTCQFACPASTRTFPEDVASCARHHGGPSLTHDEVLHVASGALTWTTVWVSSGTCPCSTVETPNLHDATSASSRWWRRCNPERDELNDL